MGVLTGKHRRLGRVGRRRAARTTLEVGAVHAAGAHQWGPWRACARSQAIANHRLRPPIAGSRAGSSSAAVRTPVAPYRRNAAPGTCEPVEQVRIQLPSTTPAAPTAVGIPPLARGPCHGGGSIDEQDPRDIAIVDATSRSSGSMWRPRTHGSGSRAGRRRIRSACPNC
jgi:hypothetical protein